MRLNFKIRVSSNKYDRLVRAIALTLGFFVWCYTLHTSALVISLLEAKIFWLYVLALPLMGLLAHLKIVVPKLNNFISTKDTINRSLAFAIALVVSMVSILSAI